MKEEIIRQTAKNNVCVYTRDLVDDYRYFYRSPLLLNFKDENEIYRKLDQLHDVSQRRETSWLKFSVPSCTLIIRRIDDTRVDMFYRPIKRYEGVCFPFNIEITEAIPYIEEALKIAQSDSNNYNYGKFEPIEEYYDECETITKIGELYKSETGSLYALVDNEYYKIDKYSLNETNKYTRKLNKK